MFPENLKSHGDIYISVSYTQEGQGKGTHHRLWGGGTVKGHRVQFEVEKKKPSDRRWCLNLTTIGRTIFEQEARGRNAGICEWNDTKASG